MKHTKLYAILGIVLALTALESCRKRPGATQKMVEEYGDSKNMSTPELHEYLKTRVNAQIAKAEVDDGSNPATDVWDYYIDEVATNKLMGSKLRNHRDFFGVPLTSLRFPAGTPLPDPCPELNKLDVDGKPACNAMDNLMRYMWEPKKKAQVMQNPKDWFVNLIPQFYGSNQPALKRFLKDGDIIVYFHPENRRDEPGTVAQWRASHAATIMIRESDGAILTVDTPAGYAKPFNGMDATPFHVFRFVPRDFKDWNVVDEYGKQIARWGTLGFNRFNFQGDYDVMADSMKSEGDIDTFAKNYLNSAKGGGLAPGFLPAMYCAWFAWTNVNLGWMRPMSPSGLGGTLYNELAGTKFANVTASHTYAGGDFDRGYAVPKERQSKMTKRNNFAVMPMTAPELLLGMLDRMVGRTADIKDPAQFIAMAKTKAGILAEFASSASTISTFQAEQRAGSTDQTLVTQYNANVLQTFQTFAKSFSDLADQVAAGAIDVSGAQAKINEAFIKVVKDEWTTNKDISKKWIPPYGFVYHAEYGYEKYNVQDKAQPVMVYVGTVVHEGFLRKKGTASGTKTIAIVEETPPTTEDLALDKEIYAKLGCDVKEDGLGWKALLGHLNPSVITPVLRPNCGQENPALTKMNRFEFEAVSKMVTDWTNKNFPSQRDIYVHNTFGLDTTIVRRLLVSYWNDPTEFFKPSIYEGDGSTIASAVQNIRILLHDNNSLKLNAVPATEDFYNTNGHPRRSTEVPCVAASTPNRLTTCRNGPWAQFFAD